MISIFLTQVDSCSQRRRLLIWALQLLRHWSTNSATVFTCAFVSTCYESKAYVSIYVCLYMCPYVCIYLFSTAQNCQNCNISNSFLSSTSPIIYCLAQSFHILSYLLSHIHSLPVILTFSHSLSPSVFLPLTLSLSFFHSLCLSLSLISFSLSPSLSFFHSLCLSLSLISFSLSLSLSLSVYLSISAYSIWIPFFGLTVFHIRIRYKIMRVRTWLLLPAVVTPPFWKAGFNFFKAEIEVSSLIPTYVVKVYFLHLLINFHWISLYYI